MESTKPAKSEITNTTPPQIAEILETFHKKGTAINEAEICTERVFADKILMATLPIKLRKIILEQAIKPVIAAGTTASPNPIFIPVKDRL